MDRDLAQGLALFMTLAGLLIYLFAREQWHGARKRQLDHPMHAQQWAEDAWWAMFTMRAAVGLVIAGVIWLFV